MNTITYYIMYKPASGLLAFGVGEVTKEMVADAPDDTVLIQLGEIVEINTGKQLETKPTSFWLMVFKDLESNISAIIGEADDPVQILDKQNVSWNRVLNITRIMEEDLGTGTPLFI